ncbi:MAG: hypothetical protein M0R03_23035 [Novosphingobium sp.]|nr:hypothetical protein [Novosphingobium sp.]
MEKRIIGDEVENINGEMVFYTAAVNLMDDDLREELHNSQNWGSEQKFFTAYEYAHLKKFYEVWELSKSNPTW